MSVKKKDVLANEMAVYISLDFSLDVLPALFFPNFLACLNDGETSITEMNNWQNHPWQRHMRLSHEEVDD